MNVYFSVPIDRNPGSDELADKFSFPDNTVVYNPRGAFSTNGTTDSNNVGFIVNINSKALLLSDVVVVMYLPGVESWGVPMELNMAHDHGIRTVVVYNSYGAEYAKLPIYLKSCVKVEDFVFIDDFIDKMLDVSMELEGK
jgi:hypothetical protein